MYVCNTYKTNLYVAWKINIDNNVKYKRIIYYGEVERETCKHWNTCNYTQVNNQINYNYIVIN